MKRSLLFILVLAAAAGSLLSFNTIYAEHYYRLYHRHFYHYPEDAFENINYLEQALRSDFANPLHAIARIENKAEWKVYRNLFRMHINLKLVEQYLILASRYDKREAFFYNYPWKKQNLDSLEKAEKCYFTGLDYWKEARRWSRAASKSREHLEEIQFWHDESWRIEEGELDYEFIIGKHVKRLRKVRESFENMDESTY